MACFLTTLLSTALYLAACLSWYLTARLLQIQLVLDFAATGTHASPALAPIPPPGVLGLELQNCQVLERKYFAQFMDLHFDRCEEFEELHFSIAVHCDGVANLNVALKEVPLETDWLCLTDYRGVTMETDMFSRFTSLNALYIETRNVEFQPGTFSGLSQLTTLRIGAKSELNNITFHKDTFYGLNSLQELKISYIQFSAFNFSVFNHLHLLDHLFLEENNITYLSAVTASLGTLTNLKKLSVIGNKIAKLRRADCLTSQNPISYGQFVDFNISHLDLSANVFSVIEQKSLCNFPHLELFTLGKSGIEMENVYKSGIKTIKTISLQNNGLYTFQICAYASHFKAEELLLMFSAIYEINTFKGSCKYLKKLNLTGNALEKIGVQQMQKLDDLLDLDLSKNNIESLKTCTNESSPTLKLIYLNVSSNYLTRLQKGQFACLKELKSLSLENNKINHIDDLAFDGLDELQLLNLQSNNLFSIGEFTLSNLFLWSPFVNFTKLEKLYYSGNPEDISNFSAIINSLNYLPSLKFLYLHDTNNIIKYNQINVNTIFQNLSHLKLLHLKNSGIDHLNSKVIFSDLYDLEFLIIENQNMQEVDSVVFDSMPNLKYIYFLQTTFPCSCHFKGLVSWLESNTHVSVIDFHNQGCLINHISMNLIFFLNNNCQSDLDFIMFLLSFLCTLLFMCISLFYESIWWYILYIVYTIKCWLNHRLQHKGNYEYDVFVSYNTNNEQWVTEQLLPNLEQNGAPFFKVCIHNRDFEIGKDIVENIMDSIYNSRWTVCIITHSYLQSNWCSLEMRMATYRLLTESKDSLILIFLDKISREELHYYHRLTKVLNKKTYLDWPDDEKGQQLFWARLRKVIAKSGRKCQ
ncbi:PREDICTED: toll-like receptor 13 [Nanorana parkeri]|uniref:toll-like receptor 13 n=1 Tax=Nanorana parkeri TaxID=125878 RepID=UPI0008550673|nr:PREDICTED: toll-like receptor 13 [Nanorana parkeri]